jgi:hypothetical protein
MIMLGSGRRPYLEESDIVRLDMPISNMEYGILTNSKSEARSKFNYLMCDVGYGMCDE